MNQPAAIATQPCRHGLFAYPVHDEYIGRSLQLYGEWSEGEVNLVRSILRPGDTLVEVGSNIGTHTVPLAKWLGPQGRVYAFEPQRLVYQLLCANLVANHVHNVWAYNFAVDRAPGSTVVPEIALDTTYNFGAVRVGAPSGTAVPVTTIDSLQLERVDFIKIDAEDCEPGVLLGAMQTIDRFRPPLLIEYNNHLRAAINRVLRLFPYRAWAFDEPLYSPANFNRNPDNVFGAIHSLNILLAESPIPGVTDGLRELTAAELA